MTRPDLNQIVRTPDGRPEVEQPKWRRDFPIDLPQDEYVARRDFTKFMVLTSLAFAVGQVWIGIENWRRRRRGQPPIAEIAKVSDVPIGSTITFAYPQPHDACLLVRTGELTWLAYAQECTHLACAVIPEVDKGQFRCPCHHGYFDLTTGRPIAGPPRRPLPRITLDVRNGAVYATGVEERTA
ncbi:MAG: Rieske 2Fe-2S domain-containing protein [Phycisphaerales bacterium]|nr:Rieske 2Fe-2S domain-containing protein [Phycisphaerales bacterium]